MGSPEQLDELTNLAAKLHQHLAAASSLNRAVVAVGREMAGVAVNRPDWSMVAEAVKETRERILGLDPGMIGSVDAGQAALSDTFLIFGLNVRDEQTLFTVLSSLIVLSHMANSNRAREHMSEDTHAGMLGLLNAVVSGLSDFLPPDVK